MSESIQPRVEIHDCLVPVVLHAGGTAEVTARVVGLGRLQVGDLVKMDVTSDGSVYVSGLPGLVVPDVVTRVVRWLDRRIGGRGILVSRGRISQALSGNALDEIPGLHIDVPPFVNLRSSGNAIVLSNLSISLDAQLERNQRIYASDLLGLKLRLQGSSAAFVGRVRNQANVEANGESRTVIDEAYLTTLELAISGNALAGVQRGQVESAQVTAVDRARFDPGRVQMPLTAVSSV